MKSDKDFFNVQIYKLPFISQKVLPFFDTVVQNIPLILANPGTFADLSAKRPSEKVSSLLSLIHAFGTKGWVQFFVALELNNLDNVREIFLTIEELKGLLCFVCY